MQSCDFIHNRMNPNPKCKKGATKIKIESQKSIKDSIESHDFIRHCWLWLVKWNVSKYKSIVNSHT